MKKVIYLLFISALFIYGSCDDEEADYQLPSATQKGANTIGCKVNGIVCIPKSAGLFSPKTKKLCYNEQTGELNLMVDFIASDEDYKNGIPRTTAYIKVDSIFNEGIQEPYLNAMVSIIYENQHEDSYYYTIDLPDLNALVKITKLDKVNKIISGVFNFEGYLMGIEDYDFTNKVKVTDGRFDFEYNPDGTCIEGYSNKK